MWRVTCVFVLAACGDNVQPIEVRTPTSTPDLFTYFTDGKWITPPHYRDAYLLEVGLAYKAVMVCSYGDGTTAVEILDGRQEDGDQVMTPPPGHFDGSCATWHGTDLSKRVVAHVVGQGTVTAGGFSDVEFGVPEWDADIVTHADAALVVASDASYRKVIVKELTGGPTGREDVGVLDLATGASELDTKQLTVGGIAPEDGVYNRVSLIDGAYEDYLSIGVGLTVRTPSAAVARYQVEAIGYDQTRTVTFTDESPPVALMTAPVVENLSDDQHVAVRIAETRYDATSLSVSTPTTTVRLTTTRSVLAMGQPVVLDDRLKPPGMPAAAWPAWDALTALDVTVSASEGDVTRTATLQLR